MSGIGTNDEEIRRWTEALQTVPRATGNDAPFVAGKALRIYEGVDALALVDGSETFKEMYAAIATTLSSPIGSNYYIYVLGWWMDDMFPLDAKFPKSTLHNLFKEAAEKGIEIRVLLWHNLFKDVLDTLFRPSLTHEAIVKRINQLPPKKAGGGVVGTTPAGVVDTTPHWRSHHQKVLIVKGKSGLIGFCGGIDFSRDRIEPVWRHYGSPYHDVHCRLKGDVVHDLVDVFVERWETSSGWGKLTKEQQSLRGFGDRIPQKASTPSGKQHVGIARTFNILKPKQECAREYSVQSTLIAAIRAAHQYIYIEDQYLTNVVAAQEIGKALKHLQNVTILIPHSAISDLPSVWERRRQFLAPLLDTPEHREKVQVYYRISPPKERTQSRVTDFDTPRNDSMVPDDYILTTRTGEFLGQHSYIHAKLWIFDDVLAVIGSANCNKRGWSYDGEVVAAIFDVVPNASNGTRSFARELRKRLWSEHLGISNVSLLEEPLASAKLWKKQPQPPTSRIRPYNHNEDKQQSNTENSTTRPLSGDERTFNLSEVMNWIAEPPTGDLRACQP